MRKVLVLGGVLLGMAILTGCSGHMDAASKYEEQQFREAVDVIRRGLGSDPARADAYNRAWQLIESTPDKGWEAACRILGGSDECRRMHALGALYDIALHSPERSKQVEAVDILMLAKDDPSVSVRYTAYMLLNLIFSGDSSVGGFLEFPEGGSLEAYRQFVQDNTSWRERRVKERTQDATWWKENRDTFDFRAWVEREKSREERLKHR